MSDDVRYFTRDQDLGEHDQVRRQALGIAVIAGGVAGLEIVEDRLTGVRLDDGQVVPAETVAVASRMVARAEAFAGIGITATQHPAGSFIAADVAGRTSVPGVWAAGNATDLAAQVGAAAADGARAAAHLNADLVAEDTDRAIARLTNAQTVR